ncbi:MAG: Rpn family recombination-promoting nuclease/putative transposase [Planctomycetota bacterium]
MLARVIRGPDDGGLVGSRQALPGSGWARLKFVFGEPEQMAELLRACLPAAVADAIDWSTLQRVRGSVVDKALGERHTDMLFSARMGSATVLLYVVPEHKCEDERFTSWQMACCVLSMATSPDGLNTGPAGGTGGPAGMPPGKEL